MFELGAEALKTGTQLAVKQLEKAHEFAHQDSQACEAYLESTQFAIAALEKEHDQILVAAKNCNLDSPEQVTSLRQRIETYLFVDELRLILQGAISGLGECREALKTSADRFFMVRPGARTKRQDAVSNLEGLLERLETYLKNLDESGLRHRPGGSGVGADSLIGILNILRPENQRDDSQQQLALFVEESLWARDKSNLLEYTCQIEKTINEIYRAFR